MKRGSHGIKVTRVPFDHPLDLALFTSGINIHINRRLALENVVRVDSSILSVCRLNPLAALVEHSLSCKVLYMMP